MASLIENDLICFAQLSQFSSMQQLDWINIDCYNKVFNCSIIPQASICFSLTSVQIGGWITLFVKCSLFSFALLPTKHFSATTSSAVLAPKCLRCKSDNCSKVLASQTYYADCVSSWLCVSMYPCIHRWLCPLLTFLTENPKFFGILCISHSMSYHI